MTYRRVLQEVIDPQEFEQAMSNFTAVVSKRARRWSSAWMARHCAAQYRLVRCEERICWPFMCPTGVGLAEAEVERKENEIVIAPRSSNKSTWQG